MSAELPENIVKALEKADDALQSAIYDLGGGFVLATANRAYYACYYCIIALLHSKFIFPKTHQGAHSKFFELFVKTGIIATEASEIVTLLFDYRQQADYDLEADISEDDAKQLINKAATFLHITRNYFDK